MTDAQQHLARRGHVRGGHGAAGSCRHGTEHDRRSACRRLLRGPALERTAAGEAETETARHRRSREGR